MDSGYEWVVQIQEPILQHILARRLKISPLLAQLLINRGFYTVGSAQSFLKASLQDLHHPLLMHGMGQAVHEIKQALANRCKILIYGDYDVDGVTGTVFLVDLLRRLGGDVDYHIPNRVKDGYGLNEAALTNARENGVDLVITVDCGISSVEEVAHAQQNGGPKIIITDHHQPPEILPAAAAIINPKQPDCPYPFKELAGVGVAFKLGQALLDDLGKTIDVLEYLDLVCLGTVADIVSLQGENRILVRHGLKQLNRSKRPGIQALCRVAGIKQEEVGTGRLGFTLAPRINAAGRLGDAKAAVELLLAAGDEVAATLATTLNQKNQRRQRMEADTVAEAVAMVESDIQLAHSTVLVLASDRWHSGVIGIVAARLVDRYGKPVLLIASEGDLGKGSARSVPGFNLYQALQHCQDVLEGFGGHAAAAGFSVSVGKIDLLAQKINQYAQGYLAEMAQKPQLKLDALVNLDDLTVDLVEEIEKLAPFGQQNPSPLLGVRQAKLLHCHGVGQQKSHLKMLLEDKSKLRVDGIGFNLGNYVGTLNVGSLINVAFAPTMNTWQGKTSLQVNVKDLGQGDVVPIPCTRRQWPGEEQLLAAKDLIFVPETMLGLLHSLMQSRGHDVPPAMHYIPGPEDLSDPQQEINHTLPPGGGHGYATGIDDPNFKKGKTLLLVNSVCRLVQLVKHMDRYDTCDGNLKKQQFYVHGFMAPDLVQKILQGYAHEKHGILLTTFNCLQYIRDFSWPFEQVYILEPPMLPADWSLLQTHVQSDRVNHAGPWPQLQARYNGSAWQHQQKYWGEMAPDRKMLGLYYMMLKKLAKNNRGLCDPALLQKHMMQQGYALDSWLSLVVAAAVFADLDLLQYQWQDHQISYQLPAVQGAKKDLDHSPVFTQVHWYKKLGLNWLQQNVTPSNTVNGM